MKTTKAEGQACSTALRKESTEESSRMKRCWGHKSEQAGPCELGTAIINRKQDMIQPVFYKLLASLWHTYYKKEWQRKPRRQTIALTLITPDLILHWETRSGGGRKQVDSRNILGGTITDLGNRPPKWRTPKPRLPVLPVKWWPEITVLRGGQQRKNMPG